MMDPEPFDLADDPLPAIEEDERSTVELLQSQRPIPTPAFLSDLRELLEAKADARAAAPTSRRPAVHAIAAACLGTGVILLAVAAIGLTGSGPFGA